MQTYLVGGAVRDELLGLKVKEKDWVVVGADAQTLLAQGYTQVGKDFPVFLHPKTRDEYALARTERKSAAGYTGFEVFASPDVTLEQDLLRRDLTINAIAQDENGQLIDPYNGLQDLEDRVLRHVSDAFTEDPLRILRVARFAARFYTQGFRIAPDTLKLMEKIVASGELETIAPERIWTETVKALVTDKPSVFFSTLRDCSALKVWFPEVEALFGVPQRADYHPEIDTGIHTMMVLDQSALLTSDVATRFAALTHDLGKAKTPEDVLPSHHGHEAASVKLIKSLNRRIPLPKAVFDLATLTARYHTHAHRALELKPDTILKLMEGLDVFRKPDRFELFLLACEADSRGRTGFETADYPQADYLRIAAQKVLSVSASVWLEKGLEGKELGLAMRRERLQLLARLRVDLSTVSSKEQEE